LWHAAERLGHGQEFARAGSAAGDPSQQPLQIPNCRQRVGQGATTGGGGHKVGNDRLPAADFREIAERLPKQAAQGSGAHGGARQVERPEQAAA
jgi:hypothetical protein